MYPHAARHFFVQTPLRTAARVKCEMRTSKSWIFA